MLRLGLTGGIGAGKSEVARRLAGHGAVVIDADRLAREVVAPGTDGLAEVVDRFGDTVLARDGSLDRAALAAVVFDDEPARRALERIVHPRVRARAAALAAGAPADAVVVNDVPLLVEAGLSASYHLVLVVTAAESTRVARLVGTRGMTRAEARARIRAQADDAARRAAADVLLPNDGSLADLRARVDAVWRDRLMPFEANLRSRRPVRRPDRSAPVPYDPRWPEQYRRLAARVRRAAGAAALRVDHVGSTAVPGLAGEDVIDIQLTVADLATADRLADPLAEAGFPRYPGTWSDSVEPDVPDSAAWEKRMHGGADPARPLHLHVRAVDAPGWRLCLLLRDWLRADGAARAEYAALRSRLSASGTGTGEYAAAKEPWCDRAWPRAREWADRTGWQPPP